MLKNIRLKTQVASFALQSASYRSISDTPGGPLVRVLDLSKGDLRQMSVGMLDSGSESAITESSFRDSPGTRKVGEVLGGRYVLEGLLGSGGMGVVWLAYDPKLDRRVAIKVLPPKYGADPRARERFHREAINGGRLTPHPNVVVVHDVGGDDEPFIVQEYVAGEDLGRVLERYPDGLPLQVALALGVQVASALEHAHTAGVIHHDVKPANVMVDENGRAKLGDFGLSLTVTSGKGNRHSWVGTLMYLAPEQIREGARVDTDCYSLGCLLYELFTGMAPFDGCNIEEVISKKRGDVAQKPIILRSHLPADLSELIMQLLSKDPVKRPSAAEVRSRLSALLLAV